MSHQNCKMTNNQKQNFFPKKTIKNKQREYYGIEKKIRVVHPQLTILWNKKENQSSTFKAKNTTNFHYKEKKKKTTKLMEPLGE